MITVARVLTQSRLDWSQLAWVWETNTHVCPYLAVLPEDAGPLLANACQCLWWLHEMDPMLLMPMIRQSSQDFFCFWASNFEGPSILYSWVMVYPRTQNICSGLVDFSRECWWCNWLGHSWVSDTRSVGIFLCSLISIFFEKLSPLQHPRSNYYLWWDPIQYLIKQLITIDQVYTKFGMVI